MNFTDVQIPCHCFADPSRVCPQGKTDEDRQCFVVVDELKFVDVFADLTKIGIRGRQREEVAMNSASEEGRSENVAADDLSVDDSDVESFDEPSAGGGVRQTIADVEAAIDRGDAPRLLVDGKVETMDSTSDDRVRNNVMRHNYRVLREEEREQMRRIKDLGLEFVELLHEIGGTPSGTSQASRGLSIAQTKVQEAVMWAVYHVTG